MQDKRSQKQILQYPKKLLIDKGFQITIIVEIEDELLKTKEGLVELVFFTTYEKVKFRKHHLFRIEDAIRVL